MYKLVLVELADVVPRRDANKPNLYVGFADAALEGLDDVISHAKEWARGHEVELCQDLARDTRFTAKKSAKKARAKLVRKLGNQGYTVNRDTTVYRMYVIELGAPSTAGSGLCLRKSFRFVAGRRLSSAALFGLVAFAVIHSLYRGFSWSSTMLCRSFRMADAHKFQFIIAVSGVRPPTRSLAFGSPKYGGPICQTPDMARCW